MPRSALLLASTALLITSAAPPPLPAAPVPGAAGASQDRSPVRCNSGEIREVSNVMPAYLPPPPPPPPPPSPAPMPTPEMAQPPVANEVVVTGVRAQLQQSQSMKSSVSAITAQDIGRLPDRRRGTGPGYVPPYGTPGNTERYDGKEVASVQSVASQPVSTFSVDVDTGAYANVRRFLNQGQAIPEKAVRTEEMINYFRYDYPRPQSREVPFSVTTDVARTPWNANSRLLRIGLRGYDVGAGERPAANLVFLIDVSGSMSSQDKLPLVKQALTLLADRLTAKDHVSIVVYAGSAGLVLEPTHNKDYVKAAISCLESGGSTAGGAGIRLAYSIARANYIKGGINRILLATDGDFNVGVSDNKALEEMVKREREDGVTLTTLGFGTGNYNEAMMERIADVGNGNYSYIDSAKEAQKVLDDELSATLFTIAKDVKIQVEFNPAKVKEYRLIGYENRALAEEDFNNDTVDAGDIGAGHQVTALYEIVPADSPGWLTDRRYPANRPTGPAGSGDELAFVKLRYKLPGQSSSKLIERPVSAQLMSTAGLPRGDMAFITSVAAFGQRLRGDKYLNGFNYSQIAALAGPSENYWRSEFAQLVRLADAQTPRVSQRE
jgi:Ca-activated chloride channel homolog